MGGLRYLAKLPVRVQFTLTDHIVTESPPGALQGTVGCGRSISGLVFPLSDDAAADGAARTQAKPTAQQLEVEGGRKLFRFTLTCEPEKQWTKEMGVLPAPGQKAAIHWARKTRLEGQHLL